MWLGCKLVWNYSKLFMCDMGDSLLKDIWGGLWCCGNKYDD